MIDLTMTSDKAGEADNGDIIPAGTTVLYCGHVVGGMVKVQLPDGREVIMHPHCFPVLRS